MSPHLDGRYALLERLGAGGMGEVWRAHDERTGDTVAVKRLHPHLRADPSAMERFRREVTAAATIDHPGTVSVRSARLDSDEAYIVMEYVPGGSLADRLARDGRLPILVAVRIAAEVAGALAAAHGAGIVHRDVTPSNVLLDPGGVARLADFGIARSIEVDAAVTSVGDVVGTLRSMAPEVLAGAGPTPAGDVWSLGALLYEALSGRPPYATGGPVDLLAARSAGPPPIEGVPGRVNALLARMLDPDPAVRPADGAAAHRELRALETELLGPPAGPDDETVVVPAVAPPGLATRSASPRSPTGRRRGPGLRVPAAALITALGASVLLLALVAAGPMAVNEPAGAVPSARTESPQPSPAPDATVPPAAGGDGGGTEKAKPDKGKGKGNGGERGRGKD